MVSEPATLAMEWTEPETAGLDPERLERLSALVQRHVDEGRYIGAQMAMARDGRLAFFESYGLARNDPAPASDETMWLLFSQTKPLVAATVWALIERDTAALPIGSPITCRVSSGTRRARSPSGRC